MSDHHSLLRPADPTRRPRFSDTPGERVDTLSEERGRVLLLRVVFGLLTLATLALIATTVMGMTPWWAAGASGFVLLMYIGGLRRAELHRRERQRQARFIQEESRRLRTGETPTVPADERPCTKESSVEVAEERAATQVAAPGEWIPRPVPRPTYALRGDVEDMATRHAAHRAAMVGMPLEAVDVEEREAQAEGEFPQAVDLHLDDVLDRRRSA